MLYESKVNLASGRNYYASTNSEDAGLAFDSSRDTAWHGSDRLSYCQQLLRVDFGRPVRFNRCEISELYDEEVPGSGEFLLPRTESYRIEYLDIKDNLWKAAYRGKTIGNSDCPSSIIFSSVTGSSARISFVDGRNIPAVCEFKIYDDSGLPQPEPAALPEGSVRIEAETMKLDNCLAEQHCGAGRESVIKVSSGTGTASFVFNGDEGYYNITLNYFDGPYGRPVYKVLHNGRIIDEWFGTWQFADGDFHTRTVKENRYVAKGDVFTLEGTASGKVPAIFERTMFVRLPGDMQRKLETGYLVDDIFNFWPGSNGRRDIFSGWEMNTGGGTISKTSPLEQSSCCGYDLVLKDTIDKASVSIERSFIKQSSGIIVFECRFALPGKADGISWVLGSGGTEAVKIITSGKSLCYVKPDGELLELIAYETKAMYGMRIDADISDGKTEIFINGQLKTPELMGFTNPTGSLDGVRIKTGESSTGILNLAYVRIYKGFLLHEDFMSCGTGLVPHGWKTEVPSGGKIGVQEIISAWNENNSLKIEDKSITEGMVMEKSFTPQTGTVEFEYKFLLPEKLDGFLAELGCGSASAITITTHNGSLCRQDPDGSSHIIEAAYRANLWYSVRITAYIESGKADIYINERLAARNVHFINTGKIASLDTVRFSTLSTFNGTIWLDDIKVYKPVPRGVAPEPKPVSTGDYIVAAQNCSIWRTGTNVDNAWERIRFYPDRIPLLGYYDDGDPEIADWDIKWCLEHGISAMFYCWYRMNGGNTKVKTPSSAGYAINEGLLRSRYLDKFKFALIYANGTNASGMGVQDMQDFTGNLVPYFIEYYFKHPCYFKIGNRPVFAIYSPDSLIEDLGGEDKLKEAVAAIRQACTDAGFDGLTILAEYREDNPENLKRYKRCGFDYVYSYVWYADGKGEYTKDLQGINRQKFMLETQKNADAIDIVPTAGMGWDGSPYYDFDPVGMSFYPPECRFRLSPNGFGKVLEWCRDEFMPGLSEDKLGRKLILLDNWNEYGEGHYIAPHEQYGFGYLDAVRNVFAEEPEHEDITPQSAGLGPYDRLYPKLWSR